MASTELETLPLLSWIDVARRLAMIPMRAKGVEGHEPPQGLISSETFWTGLRLTVEDVSKIPDINKWLGEIFKSWFYINGEGNAFLRLDGPNAQGDLRVFYEIAKYSFQAPIYRPHAALNGDRTYSINFPVRLDTSPTVVAFHSVKGGVGRTTASMAFADTMSQDAQILFVDADFEAPGVSYLYRSRKPVANISLEDLLALAHADVSPDLTSTIEYAARQMLDQRIANIFVLPVKRLMDDLAGFAIRPEHLVGARRDRPYLIVDLIRGLAKKLGCKMAVVDLRAGLVDIALHFMTDPSVERVFVSTASGQSTSALKGMLNTLGHVESQTGVACRQPFVLFNQVPRHQYDNPDFRATLQSQLEEQAESAFLPPESLLPNAPSEVTPSAESALAFGFQFHLAELVSSDDNWEPYFADLRRTGFIERLKTEMEIWLRSRRLSMEAQSTSEEVAPNLIVHAAKCQKLADFAKKFEFAETATDIHEPLVTPPLQRLVGDFVQQPPIIIIEGNKGTGKTLTFRYLLEQISWQKASKLMDNSTDTMFEGILLPVFGSVNSSESIQKLVTDGRQRVAAALKKDSSERFSSTTDGVKRGLAEQWDVRQWTNFWLESIARAAGFKDGEDNWQDFLDAVRNCESLRPIAMFEGLEEEFANPYTDFVQANALRSLFREVPIKLREEAGRPVGLIVFARSDMVEAVIEQNLQQFRASYRNYALTWRDIDIHELVIWLVSKSEALNGLWNTNWRGRDESEREADLRKVWGLKLGSETGKEARSTEWVVAVLTDLTGKLTARDLVRFIHQAAIGSKTQQLDDRLLAPIAMRKAVEYTSEQKVSEYPKEVVELQPIFQKLKGISDLATPFDRAEAASKGLTPNELEILEKYGVAYDDDGSFEVPELFRIGLNMKRKGARPNIISLTRKARERAKA